MVQNINDYLHAEVWVFKSLRLKGSFWNDVAISDIIIYLFYENIILFKKMSYVFPIDCYWYILLYKFSSIEIVKCYANK